MVGRRIWDCCILADELDLLECRLETLSDVVDYFVVAEAGMTFQGTEKPRAFWPMAERWRKWEDRIVNIFEERLPGTTTWEREAAQRELLQRAPIGRTDLVLLSDVDEIPNPRAIRDVQDTDSVLAMQMSFHCFAVDWIHPDPWQGTLVAPRFLIDSWQALRDQRDRAPRVVGGGWHFSWLGDRAAHERKLHAFSHTELVGQLAPAIAKGTYQTEGLHVDGVELRPLELDGSFRFPGYVWARRCPPNWFRPRLTAQGETVPMTESASAEPALSYVDCSHIEATEGWLSAREAARLYALARSLPAPFLAVELGAYKGKSTIALAAGIRDREEVADGVPVLLSVDLWQVDGASILPSHIAAVQRAGLSAWVERRRLDTAEAASRLRHEFGRGFGVGLLFIDADHSYEGVRRDFESWSPLVRPGGIVAFHDDFAPGVSQVLRELPGWYEPVERADTLAVFRKRDHRS